MFQGMGRGETQPVTRLSRGLIAAIRIRMARQGLDQKGLAARAGLSAQYVSKRMRAELVYTVHDVEQISRALGVTPEALMMEAAREAQLID